ncbi:MAG: DUF4349 domain-containing protein [Myxococcota bacterium]
MRWLRWVAVLLAVLVSGPASAVRNGELVVLTATAAGQPVAGVLVDVTGNGSGAQGTSAPNGEVRFRLPGGVYRLAALRDGEALVTVEGVRVTPGSTARQVLVVPEAPEVLSLNEEFLQRIPAGRTYQSAVTSVPGMAGGASNENSYVVEAPTPAPPAGQGAFQQLGQQLDSVVQVLPATGADPRPADAPPVRRDVHHHGVAHLQAQRPQEVIDAVAALAVEAGGRVDRADGQSVEVRVPVATFDACFRAVLALGEVIDQRVTAEDVTDQLQDHGMRVAALQRKLDRLVALLAQARDETQRLALLDQIARTTEQLDLEKTQLRTLQDLAALSRIAVVVSPEASARVASGAAAEGMGWLGALSPFDRSAPGRRAVPLAVPEGMVALSARGPFHAESADGAALWTLAVPNEPAGDGAFWRAALRDQLGDGFAAPTERALGGWSCLDVDQAEQEAPYHWTVCLRTTGRWVEVAQAYYPSPAHRQRHGDAVELALVGGAS